MDGDSKYRTNVDNAGAVVIGDQATFIQEMREHLLLEECLDDVRASTFVPPSNGKLFLTTLRKQNLLVLCGPNRMGKAAFARFLASRVEGGSRRVRKVRRRGEIEELLNVLNDQRDLVVLAYDVDYRQVAPLVEGLREAARRSNSYLILTSASEVKSWGLTHDDAACLKRVVPGRPYTEQDLLRLLAAGLGQKLERLCAQGRDDHSLAAALKSPSQIVRFVQALSSQTLPQDRPEIDKLIQTLSNVCTETDRWFSALSKDHRYMALALALFDDLPDRPFWIVYERLVEAWRERDPSLVPLDGYDLHALQPLVQIGSRLGFRDSDGRDAVLKLARAEFPRSMRRVLPTLRELVQEHAGSDEADTSIRIAAAQALGQICPIDLAENGQGLLAWAADSAATVRAAVGHALRQMADCKDRAALQPILRMLNRWHVSHTPGRAQDTPEMYRVRWTIASTLGRLGTAVPENNFRSEILPRLEALSRDENYHVRRSVVYTLPWLGISHFSDVQPILEERGGDWHPEVREEVASVLSQLSVTRLPDVRQVLDRWLRGESKYRRKTAFRAVLLLDSNHPELTEDLYVAADQVPGLGEFLEQEIFEILSSNEQNTAQVAGLLENLVRKEPGPSHVVANAVARGIDWDMAHALALIDAWVDTSRPHLQEVIRAALRQLLRIRDIQKRQWRILLTRHFFDDDALEKFARTLPPARRRVFEQTIKIRREQVKADLKAEQLRKHQARKRKRTILVIVVIASILLLAWLLRLYYSLQTSGLG